MKFLQYISAVFFVSFLTAVPTLHATVDNLRLEQFSVEDGLSQGTVHTIFQDEKGFIWLGNDGGIDVYDGYDFRQIPMPKNLGNQAANKIKQTTDGLIWISYSQEGLYAFNPEANHYQDTIIHDPLNKNSIAVDIVEGKNNQLWSATYKSLLLYDKVTKQSRQVVDFSAELTEKDNLQSILLHQNILYIASRAGVFVYHIQEKKWAKLPLIILTEGEQGSFNLVEATKTYNLYISNDGFLYLGTNDGVFAIDIGEITAFILDKVPLNLYQQIIADVAVWGFLPFEGKLYVTSNSGLSVVNLADKSAQHLFGLTDDNKLLTENRIISIERDTNGIFWLGSNSTGIYRWDPSRNLFKNYQYDKNKEKSLSNSEIWSIKTRKNHPQQFWVSTSNGFNLVNQQTNHIERFLITEDSKSDFTSSHIYDFYEHDQKQIWLSTAKGVRLFDIESKALIDLPFNDKIKEILSGLQYSIFIDDQNILWWVGDKGIFKISIETGEIESLDAISKVVDIDTIYQFLGYLPNSEKMLISTNDALISYDNKTNNIELIYRHPDILPSEWSFVSSWLIDDNNILWLAFTAKGLVGLSLDTFERKYFFDKSNSNFDLNIYGLALDSEGDFWFSSHSGIYLFDRENNHFRNFTVNDGLPAMEFNSGAHSIISDNLFAYGSVKGVTVFNPITLKNKDISRELSIKLTQIEVLSRDLNYPLIIDSNRSIDLHHDDVGIRFEFSTLSFDQSRPYQYKYNLMGIENAKYPLTTDNYITFASLKSGEYSLEVSAFSPITGTYTDKLTLSIKVSYAPWASPVAYFIYLLMFIGFSTNIYLKRMKQRKLLLHAHEQVIFRENRLQLALTGSNSEVWDWQANNNLMFGKRMSEDLGYSVKTHYHFTEHVKAIHPDDKDDFLSLWHNFIKNSSTDENFSCAYRMQKKDGAWLWYKDLGKIVGFDDDNKPNRITGSYTNITDSRANEERALYYGEAFKQTKDWVLIINENFSRVTANQSLRDVFGWQDEEFKFTTNLLGLPGKRRLFYRTLLTKLKEGEHWRGEELILTKQGQEYHVIVNLNVSRNPTNNSLHYVCVFTDITAQKTAEKELRYLANYDYLTELPNRSLLLERIKHAMDFSARKKQSIALFFIDLDRFKQVNDSLGHEFGDLLLVEVTKRLKDTLRVDDTVARIGGDEFVVLLESFSNNSKLGQIATKIIETIEQPITLKENVVSIGASIGIALFPEDANNSDELLRNADVAMYHAKQLGRNTFQFFTPRMNYEANSRLQIESNIKFAHSNNEFINYYQPIVDAQSGDITGVEMLLRWQSKEGIISPSVFIPVTEELGLIVPITEQALQRAFIELKKWRLIHPHLFLSVNLSAQHFVDDRLVIFVKELLALHQMPADALKFEVTESGFISKPQRAISTMHSLVELGVKLALDDFGTGFSSLSLLKQLPLDFIKIDRSFISGIGNADADEAIIDATLVLARRLNMACIAEGIEQAEQLAYLQAKGCQLIQGFLFSKPLDAQALLIYLTELNLSQE